MVTAANPLATYKIAERLRECVSQRLAETPGGEPERSCVVAGHVAWDDCECGQLTVSIVRTYFSSNFPNEGNVDPAPAGNRGCGPPLMVVEYDITILRCAPIGDSDDLAPTCEALDAAAQVAAYDAWAVRWGAHCCLKAWAKSNDPNISIADFVFRGQEFVGPSGMCQGSTLKVLVGLINACPPCD